MREEEIHKLDEETLFWLSLDDEGLEIIKEKLGKEFTEKYKDRRENERTIQGKILQKVFPSKRCPDELFSKVKKQILKKSVENKSEKFLTKLTNLLKMRPELVIIASCILISIMGIFMTIQLHHVKYLKRDNLLLREKMALLESSGRKSNEADMNNIPESLGEIIFSNFTEEQKIQDLDTIQNLLLSKTKNISMDVNALQNSQQNIQITGYREDQLDDEFIIQIGFQSDNTSYKVIVSPCSTRTADIYKSAILKGKVRYVRVLGNHIIGLIGDPGTPHFILDYFSYPHSSQEDIFSNSESPNFQNQPNVINDVDKGITSSPVNNTITEEVVTSEIYQQDYESVEEKTTEQLPASI
ncbi:MAG: hypothetical protein N3G21_11375 [Candidatus Hydrogenedentes bacterium]|nr:hypothetical protein [Candidatus Hydrogenedentota bacterium]